MKNLFRYFLNGLLIIAPIAITVFIVVGIIDWMDSLFDLGIPGLGILLMVVLLTIVGFIGSSFFVKPFLVIMERLLHKVPLVSIIYSSIKDLFDAFVGDNQKFNKPVLVKMTEDSENYKMGFVTQEELLQLNVEDKVAVYFPHSYNFSGELFLVPMRNVTYLDLPSSEVMKFIVSGGVSKL
ncbi:DUF502 domain-containing protein [Pontibacter akesuensis]|uniref:Uncharacterized membrane protein n=1 Tax=Pontibacter akesuensis TaxID=388950 RepID=A0A1I7K4A1_9BACT|nr:DUF502 domain-containing protein [Pontibacter akesuensis]GHA75194.1 hypothetical protein GCM10007389_31310 [Pontibacter akesuensis]SFU92238.1 Uncharacterized membrane protein [Pontibacter akesuensis]